MPQPALRAARAAVLARLWGALAREPIPGLGGARLAGGTLRLKLPDGRGLGGDAATAMPFAVAPSDFALEVDGVPYADPARLLRALDLPGRTGRLESELDNSVANLALARAGQPAPAAGPSGLARARAAPDPLAFLEQCVVDGHPLHPCCRTRTGMSRAEVLAYAPEHRPVVDLTEVTVPADRWRGDCPPVLLVHPWQREHILGAYPWLRPGTGRSRPARPLMSLRTLALVEEPGRHVKTAVDVQMTSAVRTVSPAAIHNGPLLSALLRQLAPRAPGLDALAEAAGGVLVDGTPCRSLAMVWRAGPRLAPDELALPMAALAAASPADGRPLAVEVVSRGYGGDAMAFLGDLARRLLPPLLTLLHLGIALEAHGQNLLLVLARGRAARFLYRDMGGVRVSPARLRRHGIEAPPMRGDVVCDDPGVLRTKLFAAVVSTVLGELVAVLDREFGLARPTAWARVAAILREHRRGADGRAAGADLDALLTGPLPVKAMTAMRLQADPLADLWAYLPNPLEG